MFFGKIANWSNKKLWGAFSAYAFLFIGLILIAPISIIAWKYDLFAKASEYKLSGIGLIVVLTLAIISVIGVNFLVDLLPENKPKQQGLKYLLQLLIALVIPIVFRWILFMLKVNFEVAYTTSCYCLYFIIGGIVLYYTCLKTLIREIKLRHKAAELVEVEARKKYY